MSQIAIHLRYLYLNMFWFKQITIQMGHRSGQKFYQKIKYTPEEINHDLYYWNSPIYYGVKE